MVRFEVNFLDDHSDASLLDELRRIAGKLEGGCLSHHAFARLGARVSVPTIIRRFGSWKAALVLAGLGHLYSGRIVTDKMLRQAGKHFTNYELLVELKRVHELVGKEFLTVADFNANSRVSAAALRGRFGSWTYALKLVGLSPSPLANKRWSRESCFENLAAVWTYFGRQPIYGEMFEFPSRINGKAYESRWGTWRRAVKAFVTWAEAGEVSGEGVGGSRPSLEASAGRMVRVRRCAFKGLPWQVNARLRFRVFQRDRFKCVACGRSPATHADVILHADHITPRALGGHATFENLQTLCDRCNLGKGTLPGGQVIPSDC